MARPPPRCLLVMRHAHRQDEADELWPEAEAARPGGRPWDPPLSSLGLAQAEQAAAQLSAWQRETGTQIVAVVVSPFLRCLQTAAAACRHLGIPQMHVCWALSETLARLKSPPSGPLPTWMWPRPDASSPTASLPPADAAATLHETAAQTFPTGGCNGGAEPGAGEEQGAAAVGTGAQPAAARKSLGGGPVGASLGGMTAAEFLSLLGAEVLDSSGASSVAEAGPEAGREGAQELHQETSMRLPLAGLRVSLLPDLPDPRVASAAAAATAAAAAAPAAAATAATPGAAPDAAPDGGNSNIRDGVGGGTPPDATHCSDGEHAEAIRLPTPQHKVPQREGSAASGQSTDADQAGEVAAAAAAAVAAGLCDSAAAVTARPPFQPAQAGPATAGLQAVPYGVPCSPETMEAAHERYRAVLRTLMAAAAVDAEASAAAEAEAGDAAAACSGGVGARTGDLQLECVGTAAATWRALWLESGSSGVAGQQVAAASGKDVDGDMGVGLGRDGASEAPATPQELAPGSQRCSGGGGAAEATAQVEARETEGAAGDVSVGSGDDNAVDGGQGAEGEEHGATDEERIQERGQRGGGSCSAGSSRDGAILLITHGEAVACAATTVAPATLVYEVRHTGFVVLSKCGDGGGGNGEGGERARMDGGSGGGASGGDGRCQDAGARWELQEDPNAERGVLWMPAFED